ncbi:hypothetical protein IFM89_034821 [Coptis chinensis]|uniref:Reverse transcriptase domain-containing protein n=1 Tax=Coptis chinensis TaxID=261450 RepID=A0A835HDF1_9MAGN|nr:hypothetical protein IFM89_034821 [Coptis chinensis]
MEILGGLLKQVVARKNINYHSKCRRVEVTHLRFADDVLLLCKGEASSMERVKAVMQSFFELIGLKLNVNKTSLLTGSLSPAASMDLAGILGVKLVSPPIKYLGLPLTAARIDDARVAELITNGQWNGTQGGPRQCGYQIHLNTPGNQFPDCPETAKTICQWNKPPPQAFMLNVDGSLQHMASFGGTIRDEEGNVTLMYAGASRKRSILFLELMGIAEGLKAAKMEGIKHLVVNSDSQRAVSIINEEEPTPWYCLNLMCGIRAYKMSFISVSVQHILKEGNRAADHIARNHNEMPHPDFCVLSIIIAYSSHMNYEPP